MSRSSERRRAAASAGYKFSHDPLDSCNENLPEKCIHRSYASRPDGTPAGLFVARTHIAAVLSVFSRVETRRRRDDIRMRQRTRHARITMQTAGCRNDRTIVPGLLFTMKIPTTACGGANGPRGPGAFTRVPAAAIAVCFI